MNPANLINHAPDSPNLVMYTRLGFAILFKAALLQEPRKCD